MKEDPIPIAKPEEIQDGTAYLKTSISGKSRNYTIEIEKLYNQILKNGLLFQVHFLSVN